MERGRIVVSKTSWHRRVYGWWAREISSNPPATINLCHYMRVVVLYVPSFCVLIAFLSVAAVGVLAVTIPLWLPCWLAYRYSSWVRGCVAGTKRWIELNQGVLIGTVGGGLVLVVLVALSWEHWWVGPLAVVLAIVGVVAVTLLVIGIESLWRKHKDKKEQRPPQETSSAASLGWDWAKAKKARICPLIETREA